MIFQRLLKSTSLLLTVGGVVLLFIAIWLNWTLVHENPYNVFWGMLGNNLSTTSVTKKVTSSGKGDQVSQTISMNYGVENNVYILTTIKDANGTIKTAGIGTPDANYQEYVSVKANAKSKSKMSYFSKVIGKWTKQSVGGSNSQQASLFGETALGLEGGNFIPMANLSTAQSQKLLDYLHQNVVFDTSYNDAKKESEHGRPVYIYDVTVQPVAYVGLEKQFAKYLNIKDLDQVDPNNYAKSQPVKLKLAVDAHSHQLVRTDYAGSNRTETFSGYGITHKVKIPNVKASKSTSSKT